MAVCSILVKNDMGVNTHERLLNLILRHKLKFFTYGYFYMAPLLLFFISNSLLLVRKYMDVNAHERLLNLTLRHKLK
jgi:hypothetical protein